MADLGRSPRGPGPKIGLLVLEGTSPSAPNTFLDGLPEDLRAGLSQVFVSDRARPSAEHADGLGHQEASGAPVLTSINHRRSLDYGARQKAAFRLAIERGLDVMVVLRGSVEHTPGLLGDLVAPLSRRECDAVFGSRVPAGPQGAVPARTTLANGLLARLENRMLGTKLGDLDSGCRAYGRPLLSPVFAWAAGHPIPFPPLSRLLVAPLGSPWLDGRDGLLLLSPFMVLAVAATPLIIRRGIAGVATVCAAAAYVGTMGLWYTFTGGGAALPGRYMVAVVPLLGVMVALALDRLFRVSRARLLTSAFLIPTCAWSLVLSLLLFADRPQALTVTGPATHLADLLGLPLGTLVIPNLVSPGAASYVKVAMMLSLLVLAGLLVSRVTGDGDAHGPVAPSAKRPRQATAGVARNAS